MADSIGEVWRRALDLNVRYYEAWGRAANDYVRELGATLKGYSPAVRLPTDVSYDEVIGTLGEIHASGKVKMLGLSNANPDQIRAAHQALGGALVSVQNQYSPAYRSSRPEIDVCEELGLAFLPWSPLGGLSDAKALAEKHPAFKEIADERGVSAQQVALAWELPSPRGHPDPRRQAALVDHRLRRRGRPGAVRRGAQAARRQLTCPPGAGPSFVSSRSERCRRTPAS